MSILNEALNKVLLKEDFEQDGFYVYHGTKAESIDSLGEAGFDRVFTDSNGGNMYGPGVYSTYKLARGYQNTNGTYGACLLKMKVKSLRNFIIYDRDIAMKIYGNPSIDFQLRKIFTPVQYQELVSSRYIDYDKICNTRGDMYTSTCALSLITSLRSYHPNLYYCINGYIFFGHNDGYVCLIEDFKNVYPVAITKDGGQTFEPFKEGKTFEKFSKNDVDIRWVLGKHNYDLYKSLDFCPYSFINGFARIIKDGKANYLYRKKPFTEGPISPVWFNEAPETFNNQGNCLVMVGGEKFIIHLDKASNTFSVHYDDGSYLCKLDDFGRFINNASGAFKAVMHSSDEEDDY